MQLLLLRHQAPLTFVNHRRPCYSAVTMRVRVTSFLLSLLLVGAAIAPSPGGAERLDSELAAAPAATERLYLPSSIALTRAISVDARSARLPARVERARSDAA